MLNKRLLIDVERGRTVKGWKPRRLGGGLGGVPKPVAAIGRLSSSLALSIKILTNGELYQRRKRCSTNSDHQVEAEVDSTTTTLAVVAEALSSAADLEVAEEALVSAVDLEVETLGAPLRDLEGRETTTMVHQGPTLAVVTAEVTAVAIEVDLMEAEEVDSDSVEDLGVTGEDMEGSVGLGCPLGLVCPSTD